MKKVVLLFALFLIPFVSQAQIPAPIQTDTLEILSVKYNYATINKENWPCSVIYKSATSFVFGERKFRILGTPRKSSDDIYFSVEDPIDFKRYHLTFTENPYRDFILIEFSGYEFQVQYKKSENINNKESSDDNSHHKAEIRFIIAEKPSFQGGDANQFSVWVNKHLEYPKDAKLAHKQGRVTVRFTVDTDGVVKDVSVLNGLYPSLDEEAVRVISSSPKWEPGKNSLGETIPVTYTFPVYFQLG